jgi:hypothetical protein
VCVVGVSDVTSAGGYCGTGARDVGIILEIISGGGRG